jgi:ribosomal protein S18 acetylase RimI-like enzyme
MRPLSPHTATTPLKASRTDDPGRIRTLLARDPLLAVYLLGDLEPAYAGYCAWWIAGPDQGSEGAGDDVAALLVYTGFAEPVVLAFGAPAGLAAILEVAGPDLPRRALIHLQPEHIATLEQGLPLDGLRPMVRLAREGAAPTSTVVAPGHQPPTMLGPRDTGDIRGLLQHYPDQFFEPHQLTAGICFGVRDEDDALVAMAGTHVLSRLDGVAAIGNVVTRPDRRRRGLGLACMTALMAHLEAEGVSRLGLSCSRRNAPAMALWRRLGFREHALCLEGAIVDGFGSSPGPAEAPPSGARLW